MRDLIQELIFALDMSRRYKAHYVSEERDEIHVYGPDGRNYIVKVIEEHPLEEPAYAEEL